MIKEAITKYPVHELISKRWSARSFASKQISKDEILTLIEAAGWAASSVNEQPWYYTYSFNGTPGFNKIWDILSAGNQAWAKNASVLLMCTAAKKFSRNNEFNRHYMHDAGLANANLLTQAISMGIYGHILGGYNHEKANELFAINEDKEIVAFIALGYLGDSNLLEEPFKTRELTPRTRKTIEEISKEF